jgi:hypothetical protein
LQISEKTLTLGLTITLTIMLGAVAAQAQGTSVFTTGLNRPAKMISAGQASLMVAEAGTTAPNSGRISLVNRSTGAFLASQVARGTLRLSESGDEFTTNTSTTSFDPHGVIIPGMGCSNAVGTRFE